jgi:hypothetical protein
MDDTGDNKTTSTLGTLPSKCDIIYRMHIASSLLSSQKYDGISQAGGSYDTETFTFFFVTPFAPS